jgi:hypothetical protein
VSPNRNFGQRVPRLALQKPVLFAACLAYASHVLFVRGELDKSIEEHFHNKAINLLIPLLSSQPTSSQNEALLATAVLLRTSEQYSEFGDDAQHHLNGAVALFTKERHESLKWTPVNTGLEITAFWTLIRESIRVCFLHEEPCSFDLDLVQEDMAFSHATEEAWTNHMTYLMARLCSACWSDRGNSSMRLEVLRVQIEQWKELIPKTFEPWYLHQADDQSFAHLRYTSTWHGESFSQYFTSPLFFFIHGLTW